MTLIENKNDWKPVRLDEILIKREENDRENARSRFDTFVKVEHMEAERLHLVGVGSQKDQELPPTFYKIFRKGQILFPTRNPHLRRTAIAPCDGICGEKTLTLEVNEEVADPKLIPFLFHSASFYDHTAGAIIGSTNPHCRWRDVANYEFLLPPKGQQGKLAELLWAADNALKTSRAALAELKTLHLSVIEKSLFNRDGIRTSATEIGTIVRGVGYKPEQLLESIDADSVVLLRSNNIQDGRLDFDDVQIIPRSIVKDEQILKANDFAVCMSNGSKELVGKAARFDGASYDVCVGSFCSVFRPRTKDDSITAEQLFCSGTYRARIRQILTGSTINNLKPSDFDIIRFRIQKDQFRLKEGKNQCVKLLAQKTLIEKRSNTTKNLLDSLINQIF